MRTGLNCPAWQSEKGLGPGGIAAWSQTLLQFTQGFRGLCAANGRGRAGKAGTAMRKTRKTRKNPGFEFPLVGSTTKLIKKARCRIKTLSVQKSLWDMEFRNFLMYPT